jgi:energy-converting hydrogenase Eha subunit A
MKHHMIVEAILVGLLTVVVGTVVAFVVGKVLATDMPAVCKDWNKNHAMEVSLFFTGAVLYLVYKLYR